MSVVYPLALKNARLQLVLDAIGAGAKLEIGTAGMALVLATVPLDTPAGSVANGVLTFTMPQVDVGADAAGTPARARIRDALDADVVTGLTVGMSNADVIVNVPVLVADQKLTINSATITHS